MKIKTDTSDWLQYPQGKTPKGSLCQCCGRYNSRDVTCEAVVYVEGKVLLIKRAQAPMEGWWALPGGYLNWDETLEDGVLRELVEETGLTGTLPQFLGVYSSPTRDEDGRQNVGHAYVIKQIEGEITVKDETSEFGWFEFDKLPENIAFDHRKMIEDYKHQLMK